MKRATRMQEIAFALKAAVDVLRRRERDGVRTDQTMLKIRQLQKLEEAGSLFVRDELLINSEKLLRMYLTEYFKDDVSETAVVKTMRQDLSTDGVYNFLMQKRHR